MPGAPGAKGTPASRRGSAEVARSASPDRSRRAAALPRILLLNGSLGGAEGNSGALLELAARRLARKAELFRIDLSREPAFAPHAKAVRRADAFVLATGTYWDSWGSPLQRFLEEATPSEGSRAWLGKPAAVLVTMHSVGGKGVLSRLQGVLNTFGALIPPMTGLVVSRAGQAALARGEDPDLWRPDDLAVVCGNLLAALGRGRYRAWPVERARPPRRWLRGRAR